jgi:hypothetical protein
MDVTVVSVENIEVYVQRSDNSKMMTIAHITLRSQVR